MSSNTKSDEDNAVLVTDFDNVGAAALCEEGEKPTSGLADELKNLDISSVHATGEQEVLPSGDSRLAEPLADFAVLIKTKKKTAFESACVPHTTNKPDICLKIADQLERGRVDGNFVVFRNNTNAERRTVFPQFRITEEFVNASNWDRSFEFNHGRMNVRSISAGNNVPNFLRHEGRQIESVWPKGVAELRADMQKIGEQLYKKVVRIGDATKGQVPMNVTVSMRYDAFWDGQTMPFISSGARSLECIFRTGRREVLGGLEKAVYTMCENELAEFIINSKLLFGEMNGFLSRNPNCDALLIIEIVKFSPEEAQVKQSINTPADNSLSFPYKTEELYNNGMEFFKRNSFQQAAQALNLALHKLSISDNNSEEYQRRKNDFIVKIHSSLSACYNKMSEPRKSLECIAEINRLTNNRPPASAMYQEGRALTMLGFYERARNVLKKAFRLEPRNQAIFREIFKVEGILSQCNQAEVWGHIRDLAIFAPRLEHVHKTEEQIQRESAGLLFLKNFKNAEVPFTNIPQSMNALGIEVITKFARNLGLVLKISPENKCNFIVTNPIFILGN